MKVTCGRSAHGNNLYIQGGSGQLQDDLQTIHLPHLQVGNDEIHGLGEKPFEALSTVGSLIADTPPVPAPVLAGCGGYVVFNHQDSG